MWKSVVAARLDMIVFSGFSGFLNINDPARSNMCVNEREQYKVLKLFINRCKIKKKFSFICYQEKGTNPSKKGFRDYL